MVKLIKNKPELLPNQVRIVVLKRYEEMFKDDLTVWDNIVADFGSKEATRRNLRRNRAVEISKKVVDRDDLDPESFLKALEGGGKVHIIDSNKPGHLPEDLKQQLEDFKNTAPKPMDKIYAAPDGQPKTDYTDLDNYEPC
jgi:hypothetical protein